MVLNKIQTWQLASYHFNKFPHYDSLMSTDEIHKKLLTIFFYYLSMEYAIFKFCWQRLFI